MASQKELDKLSEEVLNPNSPLFEIVAKRGLDEVLGANYNPSKKSVAQIKKDIMRIGKNKGGLIYPMNEGGKVGELSSPQILPCWNWWGVKGYILMNEYSNRLKQMSGIGSISSRYSPNPSVPPRSRMQSASTPSDEYFQALDKVSKAKSKTAKNHYLMEAERIKMKG